MKDEINYNGELLHDLIDEVKKNEDLKKKTEKLLYKKSKINYINGCNSLLWCS